MQFHASLAFLSVFTAIGCSAQSSPAILGFVTQPGTTNYAVNGTPILCDPLRTDDVQQLSSGKSTARRSCPMRTLGDSITVYGHKHKNPLEIEATAAETSQPQDIPVSGFALLDRVLSPLNNGKAIFRADGYPLHVTPSTTVTFQEGSKLTLNTVGTNVWVRYAGTLHPDGTVSAKSLAFSPNIIKPSEDKLRSKSDFDAAAVKPEDRQGTASRLFFGPNGKHLPASSNQVAQQRLVSIGEQLIPAYQRQLPAGDPTRIDFRFQLVDEPKLHSTLAQPSGVIQVPESFASTLTDDSKLAAVLAACIADVLEKQSLRAATGNNVRTAANLAGTAAGFFLPGAGLATTLITGKSAIDAEHRREDQLARTSLTFMQDAGFDLTQAPVAWWKLEDKHGKGLAHTRIPYLSQSLYRTLSTAYRGLSAPPAPPASATARVN